MDVSQADNSVKNLQNLLICNLKPDPHNIYANGQISSILDWMKIHWYLLKLSSRKEIMNVSWADYSVNND